MTDKKDKDVIHMDDHMYELLKEQRRAFIAKFGREPGPSDPVFFDPSCDRPTPITPKRLEEMFHDVMLSTTSAFSKKDN